jgi:hydrogenase maturation protease
MSGLRAKIIGIGQDAAGDDGIGIAVARRLRNMRLPDGIEVIERAEPSAIITQLIDGVERVILVDAIIDNASTGRIVQIDPSRARASTGQLLSTHGIGLLEAIDLARTLDEVAMPRQIVIVGITIEQPTRYRAELSASVAAAIPLATELVLRLAAA